MLLNRVEKALMNNPVRASVQRHLEVRRLKKLGGTLRGGAALEVGCGRGVGTRLILDEFGAERVDAFDLDPHMVELARRRLASQGDRVRLWVGDVARIEAADATYDAVFDFGIIHHVPTWRSALAEVARVLKPGGIFYFEEVTKHALDRASYRILFDHPARDRFTGAEFVAELDRHGLAVRGHRTIIFGDFLLGAADRTR